MLFRSALACDSLQDAKYFQARSYFGYSTCTQVISALTDSINVLGRMTGIAGVDKRTSSAAFADIKATDGFAMGSGARPVVLSPAVVSVSPQTGDQVTIERLLPLATLAVGKYTLEVNATDLLANVTISRTAEFTVKNPVDQKTAANVTPGR